MNRAIPTTRAKAQFLTCHRGARAYCTGSNGVCDKRRAEQAGARLERREPRIQNKYFAMRIIID